MAHLQLIGRTASAYHFDYAFLDRSSDMGNFTERETSPLISAVATGPLHNVPACRERHDSRKREPDAGYEVLHAYRESASRDYFCVTLLLGQLKP